MATYDKDLPGFVSCTKALYESEMARLKALFGESNPLNWEDYSSDKREASLSYIKNIYFCTDTGEIYNQEVCYGMGDTYKDQIDSLMSEVFPMSLTVSPSSWTQEIGTSLTPTITWSLDKDSAAVDVTYATVNGSTTGVNTSTYKSYTAPSAITANTSYTVAATGDGQTLSKTIYAYFRYKKYYGVSNKTTLESADVIGLANSTWATAYTLSATSFNCDGGNYPYYCIPTSLVPSSYQVWINGLQTTDIVETTVNVTNAYGVSESYTCIRTNNIQYSTNLSIQII